uniref:Uncharacterized protein n=1 Tax=Chlorobium phaeobacteroides (strain BS1) TaxID=331678 RepID=B3ELV7_CHLPB
MLKFPVSSTGMTGEGENGFPCKTCEIDAQISRVRHGNDRRRGNFLLPIPRLSVTQNSTLIAQHSELPLPTTSRLSLIIHYSFPAISPLPLLNSHYPLPTTHYPLPTTHYPLPTTHYPLSITHNPLSTIHYPQPTIHYPQPTPY